MRRERFFGFQQALVCLDFRRQVCVVGLGGRIFFLHGNFGFGGNYEGGMLMGWALGVNFRLGRKAVPGGGVGLVLPECFSISS